MKIQCVPAVLVSCSAVSLILHSRWEPLSHWLRLVSKPVKSSLWLSIQQVLKGLHLPDPGVKLSCVIVSAVHVSFPVWSLISGLEWAVNSEKADKWTTRSPLTCSFVAYCTDHRQPEIRAEIRAGHWQDLEVGMSETSVLILRCTTPSLCRKPHVQEKLANMENSPTSPGAEVKPGTQICSIHHR